MSMKLQELKDYLSVFPNDCEVKVLGFDVIGLSMKDGVIALLLEGVNFEA